MTRLRGGIPLLLALAAALAGPAHAQDPSVNESDFDTTAPEADESYLDDASAGDPALTEGDFDTSVPEADESYLASESGPSDAGGDDGKASTPGIGAALLALALVGAALLARRR